VADFGWRLSDVKRSISSYLQNPCFLNFGFREGRLQPGNPPPPTFSWAKGYGCTDRTTGNGCLKWGLSCLNWRWCFMLRFGISSVFIFNLRVRTVHILKLGWIMTLGNILQHFSAVGFSCIFEVFDTLSVFHKLVVGTYLSLLVVVLFLSTD